MAWEKRYSDFGMIKFEGNKVFVYMDSSNCKTLDVGERVVGANWAGGCVNIQLASGKVRRYVDDCNSTIH